MRKRCKSTFEWRGQRYSILSWTSAMSAWSWSIPARITCPGRVDKSPDDICHGCYAQIGNYGLPSTLDAQAARLAWLRKSLTTKRGRAEWRQALCDAIATHADNGFFRWHDSGDVFSARYGDLIGEVCQSTPNISHWIPTRSYHIDRIYPALVRLNALDNVVVRPSALRFDKPAPDVAGLSAGSTAHREQPAGWPCPKSDPGNPAKSCAEAHCRACWILPELAVSYHVHGRRGLPMVSAASVLEVNRRRDSVRHAMGGTK